MSDPYKYPAKIKLDQAFLIHYACEHLTEPDGDNSPRISSICVFSFSNLQSKTFSINDYFEILGVKITKKSRLSKYPEAEKRMLSDFAEYIKSIKFILHWNMNSSVYGFNSINNRLKIWGLEQINLKALDLIDVAEIFKRKYGPDYIENPKMQNILQRNGLWKSEILTGDREAELFEKRQFQKIKVSNTCKTEAIAKIFLKLRKNNVKTNRKNKIVDFFKKSWWLLLLLASLLLGAIALLSDIVSLGSFFGWISSPSKP